MKRHVLLSAVAVAAATLLAAPEKVASVRLGGTEKLVAAVGQLGKFTGNEVLGAAFSGSLMQSRVVQFFGPTRTGANVFFQIYADAEKVDDRLSVTVLYPVVATKAKFLKHHRKAVEKDGVIEMPVGDDDDKGYVVFSKDGQWASFADTPAFAKAAIADVSEAERPLGSSLLRLDIASCGMKGICDLAEATRRKGRNPDERVDRSTLDVLKSVSYLSLSLKVSEAGIDFVATSQVKPGTELAKVGLVPVDEKVFASLGKDVFFASAMGPDCLLPGQKSWKDILVFLREHGLRPDFVSREEKPGFVRVTLDPVAMTTYLSGPATNALAKLDAKKLSEDLAKFAQDQNDAPFVAKSPASTGAFAIKGLSGAFTPAERLKATLPEVMSKKPFHVQVGSFYATVRVLAPILLKLADAEQAEMLAPMLGLLAPDAAPGFALGLWRDGDAVRGLMRLSAAEIKGFASGFAMMAACSSSKPAQGDDDDDDDDD